jgi:1A family penicillin-binding protein
MMVRTGKPTSKFNYSPFSWVVFLLKNVGRATYKTLFFLLKTIYQFFSNFHNLVSQKTSRRRSKINFIKKNSYYLFRANQNILKTIYLFISNINYFFLIKKQQLNQKLKILLFKLLKSQYLFFSSIFNFRLKILLPKFKKVRLSVSPIKVRIRPIPSVFLSSFLLLTIVLSSLFYFFILRDLPNPNELITRDQVLSTKIYARDGTLLYKIYRNKNRSLIKLDQLPQHLVDATIAAEDKNFWSHPGFSFQGILRAITKNISTEDAYSQGGSTITQQLVKNALLSSEKSYTRKIKEVILAIEVELMFSKEEILQMYFNEIPYGGVAYGIEEASQTYLGKTATDLNLAESALLAGLPVAPTRYSPFGANPKYAIYRQRQVLQRLLDDNYIDQNEYQQALQSKISLKTVSYNIKAPHFVMYVKDLLVKKYGTRLVEEGGLEVITSLDPNIQKVAEASVSAELEKLAGMRVGNGAALVTNPKTGEILAMVGSRNYFDTQRDGNVNVTTQLRQPGSSIKPLTYALALQSGFTPASTIDDSPVSYPDGDKWYKPVNYDGQFHGIVTLRTALGSSYNIPAVKLLDKLGVDALFNFAKTMGITSWNDRSRFGLSLTLGGGEVKMVDMAVAYGVLANQGLKVDLNPILMVKDGKGKLLQDFDCNLGSNIIPSVNAATKTVYCQPQAVLSPNVAYQISHMLSDNNARTPAFGAFSLLNVPKHQVAVKTGTTNDRRDNWTVGYTQENVIVVWVGNNDNTPMSAVTSGITGATPIWRNITDKLLENKTYPLVFNPPQGLIAIEICADNGLLPCATCKYVKTEYFIPGTEPRYHCIDKPPEEEEKEDKKIAQNI